MADALTLTRNPRTGPTHYETLGLTPAATTDEIRQAFARHMSALTPRPVTALAQLSVAYETLRDPEKRRAYDASLKLPAPKLGYSIQWNSAPPPGQALVDRLTHPIPPSAISPTPDAPPKPDIPVGNDPRPTFPAAQGGPEPARPVGPIRPTHENLVMEEYEPVRRSGRRYDGSGIEWKRVAAALAWPILGVATIGAVAGWSTSIIETPQEPESVKVALPPPEPSLQKADATLLAPPSADDALPIQPPKRAASIPIRPTAPQTEPAAQIDPLAPTAEGEGAQSEAAAAPVVEQSPPVAAARMPLPSALIARTIGRIGYACGQVASTTPIEGAAGAFKVTCTSGDAYQARPVGGRYHFRRWASR